jgi:16S rRNA (guanine966-N2)-methyltransferase
MPGSRRIAQRRIRPAGAQKRGGQRFELRIIAGRWRGRRIAFARSADIRPTPDRVRETLFNWLQPNIAGSRCLDLYAGSGALGLEALSRGAATVLFVDASTAAARHIEKALASMGCESGRVIRSDATSFLRREREAFDIIFLDPPYATEHLATDCRLIEDRGLLMPGGLIYLEGPADCAMPDLPIGWTLVRSKRAGEVGYHLVRRTDVVFGNPAGVID